MQRHGGIAERNAFQRRSPRDDSHLQHPNGDICRWEHHRADNDYNKEAKVKVPYTNSHNALVDR